MNSYDSESILTRLRTPLENSGFSTLEGTFAGDLLQAVAAELARIWSQELETIADRAFAATAAGTWLDAVCADYGLTRLTDEDDDALRARVLARIRGQAASGNAADYREWALETAGVRAARAFGLLRGPNTVDLFLAFRPGADENAVLAAAAEAVAARRPLCADVRVAAATARAVAVQANVTLESGAALTAVQSAFAAALTAWLEENMLTAAGAVIGPGRISALLLGCGGVLDVTALTLDGGTGAVALEPGEYAVPGTLTLSGTVSA